MLKEEQTHHKAEVERLRKMHEEELATKLQLKELEIRNIKENY
jgi:hypothetical protein